MNSVFYSDMVEFLSLRERGLSKKTTSVDQCALLSFDRHLVQRRKIEMSITEGDVASWLQPMHSNLARHTVASKIRTLRMFLKYLQIKEIPVYIPPPIKVPETYIPYLISDIEIETIFMAADNIPYRKNSKHPTVLPMVLRMLYSCGFRLGELLAVRVCDVSFEEGIILLKDTKNKKQRIVPLGDGLTEMLYRYCLAMNLMECSENYIFPGKVNNTHINPRTIEEWFETLINKTGIYKRSQKHARGLCLHCFRHSFAVRAFARAERAGRPTQESIPFLSVYLGHNSMNETEKYLKFSSDMFPEITAFFEAYSDGIFPEVCL